MSKPLKPRRGTTAENNAFVGESYEVTYDTDKNTLVCRDGLTVGGFPLAQEGDIEALRAFIAEEVAKYLPLVGGTITGDISFSLKNAAISKSDNTGRMAVYGSAEGTSGGGSVLVYGKDNPDYPGISQLAASNGTNTHYIRVTPDGTFVCDTQNIVRSVNDNDADDNGAVRTWAINKGNVSANTLTEAGAYYLSGDSTNLPSGSNGYVLVEASNANAFIRQIFFRSGTVDSNDHNIYVRQKASGGGAWGAWVKMLTSKDDVAIDSKSIGASGYVRFVSGLQICWGTVTHGAYTTFPKAFNASPAIAASHTMGSTSGDDVGVGLYISTTKVYYKDGNGSNNSGRYIAFGPWA